jgi:hypothetical protein
LDGVGLGERDKKRVQAMGCLLLTSAGSNTSTGNKETGGRFMKIGVLSDTHASRFEEIPEAILRSFAGVDFIIHAGDFTQKPVLDGLKTIAEVKAVRGNMDSETLKNLLPEVSNFVVGNKRICVTHGWGAPEGITERVMQKCAKADVIVFGHSHEPYQRYHGDALLFNPGRAGVSCGILTVDHNVEAQILTL